MTTPLLLPVLATKNTPSWPRYSDAPRIGYVGAADAFTHSWTSDAHFAAYSVPSIEHRLTLDAIGRLRDGWPMVLLVVDIDGPGHKRTEEWWAGELLKLETLAAAHPGGFFYATRGGYRLVYRLASPFVIRTVDDKEAWRERYRRELLYLARRFAIIGDPACADITRLFRLPCVIRKAGEPPENHPTMGDPAALGVWTHEPCDDERDHDVNTARLLVSKEPKAWGPVLRALAPERGGQAGQEAAPELRPENQDEERLHRRAAAYLANMSPSIEGAGGDAALWDAALAMVRGFSLGASTATTMLLRDFNPRCKPSWDRRTVERKCREAAERSSKPWGYLRDAEGGEKGLRFKPSERRQQQRLQRQDHHEGAPMPDHEHVNDQADELHGPESNETRPDWRAELQQDRSGYRKNLANVALILSRSPEWAGCLAYDEFADQIALLRCPPSHANLARAHFPRSWEDADDTHTARWLQTEWKIDAGPDLVAHAVIAVAHEHRFHPVRDYLDGLTWDGVSRLESWLTTYLGARETIYSSTIGPMMLRAAVARVLFPGCKVDTMLVLQGLQDLGKSTAIKILCGEEWFTDDLAEFGSKDAAMQLLGVWLIEVSEMDSYGRAGVERVKAFVSRTTDRYRAAYGRHVRKQPRQCVFFGTTNADTYLRDETGNRRFWPVLCGVVGGVDLAGLARDRDQLWAEARAQVNAGMRWHLDRVKDAEALKMAKAAQGAVQERDLWENLVLNYLSDKDRVFLEMICSEALKLGVDRWGRSEQMRVSAILKRAGWTRHYLATETGGRAWGYLAPYTSSPSGVPTSSPGGVGSNGLDHDPQPEEASRSNGAEGSNGGGTGGDEWDSPQVKGALAGRQPFHHSKVVRTVGTVGTSSQTGGLDTVPTHPSKAEDGWNGWNAPPSATSPDSGRKHPPLSPASPAALSRLDPEELIFLLKNPAGADLAEVRAEAVWRLSHEGPGCPVPTSPLHRELEAALGRYGAIGSPPLNDEPANEVRATPTPPPVSRVSALEQLLAAPPEEEEEGWEALE